MKSKPLIAMIQGDPAGIGPELMIKLLSDDEVRQRADIAVIGAPSVIERGESIVGTEIDRSHVARFDRTLSRSALQHIDLDIEDIEKVPQSEVSAAGGLSSLTGLKLAFGLAKDKSIDGTGRPSGFFPVRYEFSRSDSCGVWQRRTEEHTPNV